MDDALVARLVRDLQEGQAFLPVSIEAARIPCPSCEDGHLECGEGGHSCSNWPRCTWQERGQRGDCVICEAYARMEDDDDAAA